MAILQRLQGLFTLRQAWPKIEANDEALNAELTAQGQRIDRIVAQAGGDNTEIVDARGGYTVLGDRLNDLPNTQPIKQARPLAADRFRSYIATPAQENAFVSIGDSITEGTRTNDFVNDGYMGIIRKAIQREYGNRNQGFVSFRDLSGYSPPIHQYHTITKSGMTEFFDAAYYGGIRVSGTLSGSYIEVSYVGKDAKLVYGGRLDGGTLTVSLDGIDVGTIDTSDIVDSTCPNACVSVPIAVDVWGQHTIRLTKVDNKPVDLCGMMYYENAAVISPVVHNVGRSSIQAVEIPDVLLDKYAAGATVILALGVNDQLLGADIATYKQKISHTCQKVKDLKGSLILCDFMFSLPSTDPYKTALREVSEQFPDFPFLDFAALWFGDQSLNEYSGLLHPDGVHPTVEGHMFIADTLLKYLSLPYTKARLQEEIYTEATLTNGWVNFGNPYDTAGYMKDKTGWVHLKGLIKDGGTSQGITLFTLPSGFRPEKAKLFGTASGGAHGEIHVDPNGDVKINAGGNTYLSLEGISFKSL